MGCGICFIKFVLFAANFIFALGGLGILILGVLVHYELTSYVQDALEVNISFPATTLIVLGSIIFVIAFFGCCGAIRESHCMIVTFAIIILTLLVVQVAVAVFAFSNLRGVNIERSIERTIETCVNKYYQKEEYKQAANAFQALAKCCGYDSYRDYQFNPVNGSIPYSCCGKPEGQVCIIGQDDIYKEGCKDNLPELVKYFASMMGGTALAVAAIEIIGIIFALCLASAIRNADRRGYKV